MIITFDNKEDYAIWQQTMATNGGKTIGEHEECFGNGKVWRRQQKWQEMMATLWPPPKNNTQVTTNGHGWWQDHS